MNEREIFDNALALANPDERADYLAEVCSGDDGLRTHIEGLIAAHEQLDDFLESPPLAAASPVSEPPVAEQPGTLIGPYKLLEQIGEGGMGVVYMAEQVEPVERRVALKVIKPGMDSRKVIARFAVERQALAMMDHPKIAKVLDAGTTETGRPYFVMELVKGVPITEYCDEAKLNPRQRLELFIPVCQAVQHAHQKGIIHRDIKPSNVLVAKYDDRPVPKIIDFGVAKAIEQRLTEKSVFTEFGQVVGTVEYMSPEQAQLNQLDIDTRTDVYSLGVLLYELLVGETPFDRQRLRSAAFDEVLRIIREEDPPRPSLRFSTSESRPSIAACRQVEPKSLSTLVHGELDWIVMKALEKDRRRRYETANGLARDIERYLADEPVQACSPSAAYRLRKFVRRNRVLLMTAGLVAVALIVGTLVSVSQAVRATKAETLANVRLNEAIKARAGAEANAQKARQAVDDMYTQVAEKWLAYQPQMEPVQREFLEKALQFYTDFAKLSSRDPEARFETARAFGRVADIQHRLGESGPAEKAFQATIDRLEKLATEFPNVPAYRQNLAGTLHKYGVLLGDTGLRIAEAEMPHRRALAIEEQLVTEFPSVVEYRRDLARGHWYLGQWISTRQNNSQQRIHDAEMSYREALAIQESLAAQFPADPIYSEHLAATHLGLGTALSNLGRSQHGLNHRQSAAAILEKLAAEFPMIPNYRNQLANVYFWFIESPTLSVPEQEHFLRRALEIQEKLATEFSAVTDYRYDLFRTLVVLGNVLTLTDRSQEAEDAYRRASLIGEKLVADAPDVDYYQTRLVTVYSGLGRLLAKTGRRTEAESAYYQAINLGERLRAQFTDIASPKEVIGAHLEFAEFLAASGRHDAAKDQYAKAKQLDPLNPNILNQFAWQLATSPVEQLRDPKLAVEYCQKALELNPQDGSIWITLGVAQYRAGEWQAAIDSLTKSTELQKANEVYDLFFLAMAHWQLGHKDEARTWYDKAMEWMETNAPKNPEMIRFRAEAAELLGLVEKKE